MQLVSVSGLAAMGERTDKQTDKQTRGKEKNLRRIGILGKEDNS